MIPYDRYEPLVPEVMFTEYGYDAVPDPEAFRIAIVPHDDRGLGADLLMYDPETGEVSDEYATDTSGAERCETASTAAETAPNEPDDAVSPSKSDRSESGEERPLEEVRAIAGPEDEPDHEDTENGSDDDSATEFDLI